MSDKTDEELRREYQLLLNELDRAPPEKLGLIPVADPRDATISHLQQSLRECEAERDTAHGLRNQIAAENKRLFAKVLATERERDAALAREKPPVRVRVENEWTLPYEFIDAIYEGMRSEEFTASMEAIESVLLVYERLTGRALRLAPSAPPTAVEPDEAAQCERCGGTGDHCPDLGCDISCATCNGTGRQAQKADKGSGG